MAEWDDAILIGVVARTHGNRGEVIVNSETDFPEDRFHDGARFMTRWKDGTPATLEVAAMRMHQGRPVVRFTGYESINDAERLAGLELRVDEEETEPLPDGEYLPPRPDWVHGGDRQRRDDRTGDGGARRAGRQPAGGGERAE